jgi:probable addiction module antidote protein
MITKRPRRAKPYKEILFRQLQDPQLAAGYLTEAFEEGNDVFLLALKDVVEAKGGMAGVAKLTRLNREGLYNMLSRKGNPRLSSLASVLAKLGFTVHFAPKAA